MLKHLGEAKLCRGFFFICLVLNLGFVAVGLHNSLLEVHDFRQIQTALTARGLLEQGWSLAYPTPLFGPPWSVPMEFPFYQFLVAQLSRVSPLPLEVAGRVVALAFFYSSLPACFGLAGTLGLKAERRWLLPALVLLTPAYLYYSRTFMIESTALCVSVWFLFAFIRALDTRSLAWLGLAIFCGVAGALVKVTTIGVFLITAAIYTVWMLVRVRQTSNGGAPALLMRALIATVPAIVAGALWVRFADGVKLSNPLSAYLASTPMRAFNFGTLSQRFSAEFWARIAYHTRIALAPVFNLGLILIFPLLLGRGSRARIGFVLVGFLAGPLVFANLYYVHDYYFYASGVFLLAALVLAWNQILELETFSYSGRWAVIAVSAAAQLGAYVPGYFQAQRQPLSTPPELSAILETSTNPDDIVLIFGQDWAARVPYYAHRKAVMIPDAQYDHADAISSVLDRIEPGRVTALVASGTLRKYPDALQRYVRRLGLRRDPILINDDSVLYLAETRVSEALARLEDAPPKTFNFAAPSTDSSSSIPRLRILGLSLPDDNLVAMMSPRPTEIIYPFGLTLHTVNGRPAFNAHAPTDVVFRAPTEPTEVVAEFGIINEAFTGTNHTDGVEFRVEYVSSGGTHRTLQSVYLSPNERPEDAGSKTMRFKVPAHENGQLWFRTLPGQTGSIACAWAYWAKIRVQ
ncbi:MAG: hypothetical protein ABIZ04_05600 [Opitutus sp.]